MLSLSNLGKKTETIFIVCDVSTVSQGFHLPKLQTHALSGLL